VQKPHARARLSAAAYEFLKDKLLDGAFAAGDSISIDAVIEQIGGSRQPVMEALKHLAAEGFLEIIPQVGCRVVIPDPQQIHDFFILVSDAEGLCAELAAERATGPERDSLAAIMDRMALTAARRSTRLQAAHEYRVHNREFHGQIHAMAHSDIVNRIATGLWDRSDFFISAALGMRPFQERAPAAVQEHRQIQRAICSGDGARARELMQRHIQAFRAEMARNPQTANHPGAPPRSSARRTKARHADLS
jgi:DNA-binding GntR family transcriptional regulator